MLTNPNTEVFVYLSPGYYKLRYGPLPVIMRSVYIIGSPKAEMAELRKPMRGAEHYHPPACPAWCQDRGGHGAAALGETKANR